MTHRRFVTENRKIALTLDLSSLRLGQIELTELFGG